MVARAVELLLPLAEAPARGELTPRRWQHLMDVAGVDAAVAERLVRSFGTLAAVYSAAEDALGRAVGPVAAARIRWFLDAPLDSGVAVSGGSRSRAA